MTMFTRDYLERRQQAWMRRYRLWLAHLEVTTTLTKAEREERAKKLAKEGISPPGQKSSPPA